MSSNGSQWHSLLLMDHFVKFETNYKDTTVCIEQNQTGLVFVFDISKTNMRMIVANIK